MNAYIERVIEQVKRRDAHEPEFIQTVEEVFASIEKEVELHPEYEKMGLLERLVEPERQVSFRVTWVDDAGKVNVNRGFRVQSALQSGLTRAVCVSLPTYTPALLNSWALNRSSKTP